MTPRRMFVAVPLFFASLAAAAATTTTSGASSSATSTALELVAIKEHFKNAQLVPQLLSTFDPTSYLQLSFEGVGALQPGQKLDQNQAANTPSVTVASTNTNQNGNYTLIMVDAGPVGTDETLGQTRHWLVNGVTLSGSGNNETVSNSTGTAVTQYAGPAPASGSGSHRYVVLLYSQPTNFTSTNETTNAGVITVNLTTYVQDNKLVGPVAGNYFQVEVGTATASVAPTSAVVTSTLHVPSGASTSASSSGTNKPGTTTPKTNGAIAVHKAAELGVGALSLVFFTSMAFVLAA